MSLLHPQASYHDAFWSETCSGNDLAKYLAANFSGDRGYYEQDGDLIPTPNGFVIRYCVYDRADRERKSLLLKGAEVITLSGDQIMTISDYYCETDPTYLVEVAATSEALHGRLNVVPMGLSARTSARIRRRLAELAADMTVFRDPSLSVTQLADHVSCSVMHLFHVLETQMNTTFTRFANESRARYASSLLVDHPDRDISLAKVASDSGFDSIGDLDAAFVRTFGITIDEYVSRFGRARTPS